MAAWSGGCRPFRVFRVCWFDFDGCQNRSFSSFLSFEIQEVQGHREQSGSKKQDEDLFAASDHGKGESKESDSFDGALVPPGPTLQESESACSEGQLMQGLEVMSSRGGEGRQYADEHRQAESIVGRRHGIIPSDDGAALNVIAEAVNMDSPPYLPIGLHRPTSSRIPINDTDNAQQPSEIDDTLVSTCAEPLKHEVSEVVRYSSLAEDERELVRFPMQQKELAGYAVNGVRRPVLLRVLTEEAQAHDVSMDINFPIVVDR